MKKNVSNVNVLVETAGLSHEEWLRWRQQGIGGSDVSALLGLNPWKSELELWLEKTGQGSDVVADNESMEWGRIMEPVIRKHFEEVTGKNVAEVHAIMQHNKYKHMIGDIDGVTQDGDGNLAIVEIKTASEYKRSDWEDGIPAYYETQVQHYLTVTGLEKAYVAVLIGGNTFRMYEVEADKDVQKMLIAVEAAFWDKVKNNIRPEVDGSNASKELLDKTFAGGNKEVLELPDDADAYITAYLEACAQADEASAKKTEAANKLKDLLGDHEKGVLGDHVVSWSTVSSSQLDSKALKANEPDVCSRYVKTTTSRRFSLR